MSAFIYESLTTTPLSTSTGNVIRNKNRIDYLRQRYNKNRQPTSNWNTGATQSNDHNNNNNATVSTSNVDVNNKSIVSTPAIPMPVYSFTTTKPLMFRVKKLELNETTLQTIDDNDDYDDKVDNNDAKLVENKNKTRMSKLKHRLKQTSSDTSTVSSVDTSTIPTTTTTRIPSRIQNYRQELKWRPYHLRNKTNSGNLHSNSKLTIEKAPLSTESKSLNKSLGYYVADFKRYPAALNSNLNAQYPAAISTDSNITNNNLPITMVKSPTETLFINNNDLNDADADDKHLAEIFDQKYNYISELYKKKNNIKTLNKPIRTSEELIQMAMKSTMDKLPANSYALNNNISNIHSLPMTVRQPTSPTPVHPPPEVVVTIENKFYVLRNKTATIQKTIQDLDADERIRQAIKTDENKINNNNNNNAPNVISPPSNNQKLINLNPCKLIIIKKKYFNNF